MSWNWRCAGKSRMMMRMRNTFGNSVLSSLNALFHLTTKGVLWGYTAVQGTCPVWWQPPKDTSPRISLSPNHYDILTFILMSSPNLKFYMAIPEFITASCPTDSHATAGQWPWLLWLNPPTLGPSKLLWSVLLSCPLVLSLPFQTQVFRHSSYSLDSHSGDLSSFY